MGHWIVFCAITHAPIHGRCVGIWTTRARYASAYEPDSPETIFYRGNYDTYGRIDLDKDQKYTELIPQDRGPDLFILESVYNELDKFSIGGHGHSIIKGTAWEDSDISQFNLEKIGFKVCGVSPDPRYKTILRHDTEPNKEIWSDGTWIKLKIGGNRIRDSIYHWPEFKKYFPNVDYSYLQISKELNLIEQRWNKYSDKSAALLERDLLIDKKLIPFLQFPDFRQELAKVLRVRNFMYANNLKFGPRFLGGPQDGNYQAWLKLKKLMTVAQKDKG